MKLISIALAVAAGFALSNSCAGAQTKTADLPNPIGGVKDLANRVERQDDPGADTPRVPRHPQGLYVILLGPTEVEDWISFDNTAFSGYLAAFAWSDLNPNPPNADSLPKPLDCGNLPAFSSTDPYDWTPLDTVFCAAASATPPKTVPVIVAPGFNSPQWVLDEINTNSCDGKFKFLKQPYFVPPNPLPPFPPYPTPTCHLAYFGFSESPTPIKNGKPETLESPLPMPWDDTYKREWEEFLRALNARYGHNPAFVSISVAGPTADSAEMLLPGVGSEIQEWQTILENQFADPKYWNSDQAIIDAYKQTIDMYGSIFSDITLTLTFCCEPRAGLLDFPVSYTLPSDAAPYCSGHPDMGCGAEYSILSYFIQQGVGGPNAKNVEDDGLWALPSTVLGTGGVKLTTGNTAHTTRIMGGLQSGGAFAKPGDTLAQINGYCPDATEADPTCHTLQAFYNTLANAFDDTPASGLAPRLYNAATVHLFPTLPAGGAKIGTERLNYLEFYPGDLKNVVAAPAIKIDTGEGAKPIYGGQDLLNLASKGLALTAEEPLSIPQWGFVVP